MVEGTKRGAEVVEACLCAASLADPKGCSSADVGRFCETVTTKDCKVLLLFALWPEVLWA